MTTTTPLGFVTSEREVREAIEDSVEIYGPMSDREAHAYLDNMLYDHRRDRGFRDWREAVRYDLRKAGLL